MKKFLLILVFFSGFMASNALMAVPVTGTTAKTAMSADIPTDLQISSVEEFLSLTPKSIREATGVKLNLVQTVKLKAAQKVLKAKGTAGGEKSQIIALLLCFLVGVVGVHRFYLGYTGIGIIQLLTAGGCGIWTLIDLIMIITGDLTPADGSSYNPTLKDL